VSAVFHRPDSTLVPRARSRPRLPSRLSSLTIRFMPISAASRACRPKPRNTDPSSPWLERLARASPPTVSITAVRITITSEKPCSGCGGPGSGRSLCKRFEYQLPKDSQQQPPEGWQAGLDVLESWVKKEWIAPKLDKIKLILDWLVLGPLPLRIQPWRR
jgi:hypothetical protein